MPLTILDIIVIVVLLISAILAMVRGFVREVLSIAAWVAAAVCAYFFYDDLLPLISPYIENEQIATIVSAAVIFFVALIITTYITIKVADLVIDSRAGAIDRLFGFIFGAARGLLLMVIAFQFFIYLAPDRPAWVTEARSAPILDSVGDFLIAMLPETLEQDLRRGLGREDDVPPPGVGPAAAPAPGAVSPNPPPPAAGALAPATPPPAGGLAPVDQERLNQLFGNPNPPAPGAPLQLTPPAAPPQPIPVPGN